MAQRSLRVHGECAFDVFTAMVSLLHSTVHEQFGNTLHLSENNIDGEMQQLVSFFEDHGMHMRWQILTPGEVARSRATPKDNEAELKDYRLLVALPGDKMIVVNFDYVRFSALPGPQPLE